MTIVVKLPVAREKAMSSKWLLNYRQVETGNEILPVEGPPECISVDEEPLGGFWESGSDVLARKSTLPW